MQLDAHQQRAADVLQCLHDELICHSERKRGISKRFLSRNKSRIGMTGGGVYLWGGVGRGKTMLMDRFFDSLPDSIPKRRVHFHEFMIGVHDFLHKARQEGDAEGALLKYAANIAKETKVLCFDEFHVTDIADAMILGRLFAALFDEGAVIITTSNRAPDALYEGGLQRDRFLPFIALIKERMEVVTVNGPVDYRMQSLNADGVYFWPLGAGAKGQADRAFARLTGNVRPVSETFTVKGRTIEVEGAAKGVARFSFAQLCERPMGAEDYLAVAHRYHTVFLENVPKLNYDRRNEAKRLMTLVDTFYDCGTKLVVTADAPPDHLYRGHDHSFEFQRTVSRLLEMQGAEYFLKSKLSFPAHSSAP